jgi:metal-responsive CopG/Arc/MetJ family transcriptional regulator
VGDPRTLERVDRFVGRHAPTAQSRSQVIRQAVREHKERIERLADDDREALIVQRHGGSLARQARALVRAQAKP